MADNMDDKLLESSKKEYLELLEDLLKAGIDIKMLSHCKCEGGTILHSAVKHKQPEVVKQLISRNVDVNAKNENGKTPIFYAVANADTQIIKLLLQTNVVNIKDDPDLLITAIILNCREIIEILLQYGVDINAKDEYGRTALHFTALNDDGGLVVCKGDNTTKPGIAKLLLNRGANVNAQTIDGVTILHLAVASQCEKLVELLLEYDVNVNLRVDDLTPLYLAMVEENTIITKMLLIKGAAVNDKLEKGRTQLHNAVLISSVEIVEILLKFGANIDSRDDDGYTPLHMATLKRKSNMVKALVEYGSDINIMTKGLGDVERTPYEDAYRFSTLYMDPCDYTFIYDGSIFYEIMKILECQIVRMQTANLYVSANNLQMLGRVDSAEFADFQKNCVEELEIMKIENICVNNNVTFYDVLTKNINQLVIYARNENIKKILKLKHYKIKFPIYSNIINNQIRKAFERKELLEQGLIFLYSFCSNFSKLPYNCVEQISSFLSNDELRNLREACKPINSLHTDISELAFT